MRISSVSANNHRKAFRVVTEDDRVLFFPYSRTGFQPDIENPIDVVYVDPELACEAFTFRLTCGSEESVHIDRVLEYNRDPGYLNELLLYRLTLEAQRQVECSDLSKRELIRRLDTSPSQFYRILDQTNYTKSMGQLVELLHILGCEVDFVVTAPQTQSVPAGYSGSS